MLKDDKRKEIHFFSLAHGTGGSEVYLKQLLSSFDYQSYRVSLICTYEHPFLADLQLRKIINNGDIVFKYFGAIRPLPTDANALERVISIKQKVWRSIIPPPIKLLVGTFLDIIKLMMFFRENGVENLHVNDTGAEPASIAARLSGVQRIIGTLHVMPSENKDWISHLIEFVSVRCMDVAITVSEATKNAWIKQTRISENKIKVIYNGIDFSYFNHATEQFSMKHELGISLDKIVVGVPARLHPMKGHCYLFEAIKRIKVDKGNIVFLLIGDGEMLASLESSVIQLGLTDMIKFLGYRSDVPKILSNLDFVVLPTVFEALPFALIEAQVSGKAVIASNVGGIPEIIEDGVTGILVSPRDSLALAEAITMLINDSELCKKMGDAGCKRAKQLFSLNRMVDETLYVFKKIII